MSINKKKELMKRYKQLPSCEKAVVQVLAVQVIEFSQGNLLLCLKALRYYNDNDKPFTIKAIRELFMKLEDKGLIIRKIMSVVCVESIRSDVLYDVVLSGKFPKISHNILVVEPFDLTKRYVFDSIQEFYRVLQMAIFGNDENINIDTVCRAVAISKFFNKIREDSPFLILLNRPFQPKIFDHIAIYAKWTVAKYFSDAVLQTMEPIEKFLKYYAKLLLKEPSADGFFVTELLLLHGKIDIYKKIYSVYDKNSSDYHLSFYSSNYLAQMGWAHFVSNDNKASLEYFKKALSDLRSNYRKKQVFFTDNHGIFFLFALLKSDKNKDYELGLACIANVKRQHRRHYHATAMELLSVVFMEKLGAHSKTINNIYPDDIVVEGATIMTFINILILSWIDLKKAKTYVHILESCQKHSINSGYLWVEAEIAALLAIFGKNIKNNNQRSMEIHKKCGTTTIVDIIVDRPKWEKDLQLLINIGEQGDLTKNGSGGKKPVVQQRLIWLFNHNEEFNTCYIAPRIQKLSKKGVWSKGRVISLQYLKANYSTLQGITLQDRQICDAIVQKKYHSGYYYGSTEYSFDQEKALPAFVGHPLLFLEDSLGSQVELIQGEPEIRLRGQKKNICVTMTPMPITNSGKVCIIKETPTRFKLICFSEKHLKIANIIGENGLELPKKAKDMTSLAVTAISSLITVNSDSELAIAGSERTKKVDGDYTPHVHIVPWIDGIKIQILVKPFTDSGSFYRPGRGGDNVFAEINGEKVQAIRNLKKEQKSEKFVIDACPVLENLEEVNGEWMVGEPEDALELLLELKKCEDKLILEWPKGEKIRVRSEVSFDSFMLNIKKERDWFKATGTLTIDKNVVLDLKKIMEALDNSKGRFITLDDGTFLAITGSLQKRLEELKAYSTVHGKGVKFTPFVAPIIEELTDQVESLEIDNAWKKHCNKLKEVINPEVPGTLQANLRDYQETGFKWLAQLAHWNVGACLADDMGLGKTVQALASILLFAEKGPTLVIAPLSVMGNWQDECFNFAPTLNPLFFGAGDRQKFLDGLGPFDIVIASYGLLHKEAEKLSGVNWQTVVLDEAQAIKNMNTKRSKAAMMLKAEFRIITTGTPIENHLSELWTLFNFLNPGLLGAFKHFRTVFAVPIERDQNKEASRRLKKLIRPFILRRLKTDVLKELPEKTEVTLHIEMSKEEAVLYEAQRLKALQNIEDAEDDTSGQKHLRILAELMKLRRLCCNPSLVLPKANIESSKLKVFGDVVSELLENNHKALVFSQFVGHLAILRKFLDKKKITYQYLDGSTSVKKRKSRINDFQSGKGDLFLISLKAGGAGLNLTAADYVIHMDPWWNPAVEDQASDRAHRIGQTRPVTVYRLVVKGSIEEQIVNLHREKRDLAESLLSGSEMSGKVSASELLKLLQEEHE